MSVLVGDVGKKPVKTGFPSPKSQERGVRVNR